MFCLRSSHRARAIPYGQRAGTDRGIRKRILWTICIAITAAVLVIVVVLVGLLVIARKPDKEELPKDPNKISKRIGYGGNFDVPIAAKGSRFDPSTWYDKRAFNLTYTNTSVGGLPIMGLFDLWDDTVRANPTVPSLNEHWDYSTRPIRGVNLGGWLILEPFITPSYFSRSEEIVDEFTLSIKLGHKASIVLEQHYSSFVNESTFAEIAAAGLDHVRIPYPYWAVAPDNTMPYVSFTSWRYLLRSIEWARKYGLRVMLDLHSVPGGQNGWNHSGRQGVFEWLKRPDGENYGNMTLAIHQQVATFFAQSRYKNIIQLYGLVNEPYMRELDTHEVIEWTERAYKVVRKSGFDNSIVFSEGIHGVENWKGIFPNASYPGMILDIHQYAIFYDEGIKQTHNEKLATACTGLATLVNKSTDVATGFGPTMVGEWVVADTDCATYLNGVDKGSRWAGDFTSDTEGHNAQSQLCPEPGNCTCGPANAEPSEYSDAYRKFLLSFAEAQMQAFEFGSGYFYWTWDTENSTQWSYKKGLEAGILPLIAYQRNFTCSQPFPDYAAMGLVETY